MADKKNLDKDRETLLRLIREQRSRIDPATLKMAREAIERHTDSQGPGTPEIYNREAAFSAIRVFLENHEDPTGFRERLRRLLGREETHH